MTLITTITVILTAVDTRVRDSKGTTIIKFILKQDMHNGHDAHISSNTI